MKRKLEGTSTRLSEERDVPTKRENRHSQKNERKDWDLLAESRRKDWIIWCKHGELLEENRWEDGQISAENSGYSRITASGNEHNHCENEGRKWRQIQTNRWRVANMAKRISNRNDEPIRSGQDPEQGKACSNKIPQRNIWSRCRTLSEGNDKRDKNVDRKRKDRMPNKTNHTCLHLLQEKRRDEQIRQDSEHAEKKNWKERRWLDQWTQKNET